MSIFEPEEFVGEHWHRLIGGVTTYRRHPEASVSLASMRHRLGVLYRALGGDGAIRIAESAPVASRHRLRLVQKVGLGTEKMELPILDEATLRLPGVIDIFPSRTDNEALYEWLAAWFAHAAAPLPASGDSLQDDLERLRAAAATTRATLNAWPGLRRHYARLREATLAVRPARALPATEARLEASILALLGGRRDASDVFLRAIEDSAVDLAEFRAPRGYRTFLPIPLFGDVERKSGGARPDDGDEPDGESLSVDGKRRRAERRASDQSDRGDPLVFHRFETIFSISEMVNVNRKVDDDDQEGARQAADDLPELTIGSNRKRSSVRLKMDLDLAPAEADGDPLTHGITYPEWDWKKGAYRPDHCRVLARVAAEEGEDWEPDAAMQRRIAAVRRQFEAMRPRRLLLHGQPDGDDLDLSALVRSVTDRHAGGPGSERVFTAARAVERDLSLAVLMDVSLSTDAWIGEHRVLDVEKGALLALSYGLTACGDEHAIFTFTSRKRAAVTVSTVKAFEEPLGSGVIRRISALKPGQYTRMGAAVRHAAKVLAKRPHRQRLLLLLTDGKPNDMDYYEGRYGIEDTRAAIREARQEGLKVFGVTVDGEARDYFPYLFGRGGYAIVPDAERLPAALPAIYRQLVR
ncbi:VWA domain-containing protein [Stappia sp. F7233]|uniref:VWA domain-containing protein n=1 Tax=Stappia albiluteola TaxID=2758565 RepID=A0A839A8Z7_9HYPH|nr:VWA domain-containing protein [Stappia albiluteola]MBA5775686.1 VWA domain-containing protein [Stappia albiluteola]